MTDRVCVSRADLELLLQLAEVTTDLRAVGHPDLALVDRCRALLYPPPELVDLFEQFWLAYGRKVDRKPALKAWDRAIKGGADPRVLIEAAHAYRQFCLRPNTPNQKNPATWLNAESWENELEPWGDATPSRTERNTERIKDGIVAAVQGPSFMERLAEAGMHPALGAG